MCFRVGVFTGFGDCILEKPIPEPAEVMKGCTDWTWPVRAVVEIQALAHEAPLNPKP